MNRYQKAAALAIIQAMFTGCGGGSSGTGNPAPPPPAPAPAPAPAVGSPSITTQPVSASVITGGTATFTVVSTGTAPTYQWMRNGTAISGATSDSYTTPAATYADDGAAYTVVVSNAAGSATSTAAALHLTLSTDQAKYESVTLAPSAGVYEAAWNLNYTGSQTSGTDYLEYDYAVLAQSPLTNGPQKVTQHAPVNMTTSLALPSGGVTRILKNGAVLVVPDLQGSFVTSYLGDAIQVDYLAADQQTVAFSRKRSGYSVVGLSGLVHSAPAEFANAYNSVFANPGVLNTTTAWGTGSTYLKFTVTALGDRYLAFDCPLNTTTTGSTPAPCNTGTTLAAAMTAGETSSHDNTTYHTADGNFVTVGGVNVWVATQPRPTSSVGAFTVEYRIYYELNGNVYTGSLVKDGTVESTARYRTNPSDPATTVYLNYQVRMNGAAMQSLAASSLL